MNDRISPHFRSLAHIFLVNLVLLISTGGDALASGDRTPKFDVFAAYDDDMRLPTYPPDIFAVDGLNEVPKCRVRFSASPKEQRRRRLRKNDATTGGTSEARIFKANLVQSANRKNARPVPEVTLRTRY